MREMIKLDGSWKGRYPTESEQSPECRVGRHTEQNRDGRGELLGSHVEVVHDTEQFTRGEV